MERGIIRGDVGKSWPGLETLQGVNQQTEKKSKSSKKKNSKQKKQVGVPNLKQEPPHPKKTYSQTEGARGVGN